MLLKGLVFRRYLYYEVFIKNNNVFLVSTYYPDIIFDFRKVKVEINNEKCIFEADYGYNNYEPHRTVVYSFKKNPLEENEIIISYLDQTDFLKIRKCKTYPDKNVLVSMFKDDYDRIEWFVKYYKNLGVDNFVFAYNGKLSNLEEKLYKDPYVEYIEYDNDFWVDGVKKDFSGFSESMTIVDNQARRNWHGSQMLFLSSCSIKYTDSKSITNVDLDEFILSKKENIYFLLENYDFIILRTTFSICDPKDFPFKNDEIKIRVNSDYCKNCRQKSIINCKRLKNFTLKNHLFLCKKSHGLNTDIGPDNPELFIAHITNQKREQEMKENYREETLICNYL